MSIQVKPGKLKNQAEDGSVANSHTQTVTMNFMISEQELKLYKAHLKNQHVSA